MLDNNALVRVFLTQRIKPPDGVTLKTLSVKIVNNAKNRSLKTIELLLKEANFPSKFEKISV